MTKTRLRIIGRSEKKARFFQVNHWLADSLAWKSLPPVERALYVEIGLKFNGSNNGRIGYGIREAARELHIGKSTAAAAFRILQERGFIAATRAGHYAIAEADRKASEWRLTELTCEGMPATKEFMRWPAQ